MKKLPLVFAVLMLLAAPAVFAASVEEGAAAVQSGDYQTAIANWLPLAQAGNAEAQSNLGALYANGLGVQQDYKEAVKWFRKAADQGQPVAMYSLGMMYADGLGAEQNLGEAYFWFRLAQAYGQNNPAFAGQMAAVENYLGQVYGALGAEGAAQVEQLVQGWQPK